MKIYIATAIITLMAGEGSEERFYLGVPMLFGAPCATYMQALPR